MSGQPWTEDELAVLRKYYRSHGIAYCSRRTGRSASGVRNAAAKMGLTRPRDARLKDRVVATIRARHPLGDTDQDLADAAGCSRRWVPRLRESLGLPRNDKPDRTKQRLREAMRRQLEAAGAETLAEIRYRKFREYAARRGWPESLRPRAVQILDALYERGPMTRREICTAVGLPWQGSRKSLQSNDKPGSYLAALARWGFVQRMRRARRGPGPGRSQDVYAISISVIRGRPDTWPAIKCDC